jgi:hypothetical protein
LERIFFGLVLLLIAGTTLSAQEKTADWPQFRGPGGLGVSPAKGLPHTWSQKENVLWKTELPGPGASSPIILGERVFITCYSGYAIPDQPRGQPEQLKRHLLCLNRQDGKILWSKEIAARLPEAAPTREDHFASSTPVADQERVYAFFGKSGVFAFDHEGRQLWHAEVGSNATGWGSAASPILHEDLVIVNASVESQKLYALNAKTGKEVWSVGGIREAWNTPLLARNGERTELVVAIGGKLLGIDPGTGKQLWSCATDIPWYMVPSLVAHDGVVYAIGGRPGGGLAVRLGGKGDVTRTHRLWTSNKGGNVSSPVYHDGHLYWMHDSLGIAYCADARTGTIVYEQRIARAGQVYGSAALADGRIYYPARNGTMYVVAARPKFALLATNTWGGRGTYNASPAVAGGQLFLRTDRFVCCVGKK